MTRIGIGLLCLLLSACGGGGNEDLKQWMASSSQGLRGQIEPLPQVQTYKPFDYQAYDLTDPFNPQKLQAGKQRNAANAPDMQRPREALESYDLDKLAMVGTIRRGGATYALIRTPEGAIYRVQPGNYMGLNFGKITSINDAEVQLSESTEDLNGEWVQRGSSLHLEEQGQSK
ncbi:pilus assembly protein PilP [Chromobacterium phragmitis]|uniref:Pilus assembly protein PilP n=1 Tax=Chromobacterium phragmitis TaxID=2202141 RepID=A0A344UNX3_9NEIS|nr:pilus assembly protein PilP [Chromobacterium phragmitis]AXE32574.1 pilus assembly protein PilP [Chromobacterium phragmitis]AXE36971.1 pilus assembly protein PilP [Chromobacterium phragmitis]